jgi:hypothetical protein
LALERANPGGRLFYVWCRFAADCSTSLPLTGKRRAQMMHKDSPNFYNRILPTHTKVSIDTFVQ